MARPIVLSNGQLHVGINNYGLVHDFYYPYVGLENHVIGHGLRHRVGVWVDGRISWLDCGDWHLSFQYHDTALIGHTVARNDKIGVMLEFDDAVDADSSAFMRNIHVINQRDESRDIRLFMHQAFVIGDSRSNTDTVQYLPASDAIMHYRGRRVFLISGEHNGQEFDQHSVGLFGIEGREGTWRDAEDGELSMSSVEHGRVDSTIRFKLQIAEHSSERVRYWIAAGTSLRDALVVNRTISEDGIVERLHSTAQWWSNWLSPAFPVADKLDREKRRMFLTSLMLIKSHMDDHGAIIASTDSGMLNYGRDAYAYSWPRDSAYILWPLIRLGYRDEIINYLDFAKRGLHPRGYLSHKYRADGAIGSSWHSYQHPDGTIGPPIQIDETAGVLFIFAQFYDAQHDEELLREYYDSLVVPMAKFLAGTIDPEINLPRPSYDLWEEVYMTTTYTTGVAFGALHCAADLAEVMNDHENAVAWRSAADDIHEAAPKHLFDEERQVLVKGLRRTDNGYEKDNTIDSSAIYGSFMYGLFPTSSREFQTGMKTYLERFDQAGRTALPRYEEDNYRRAYHDAEPNYWHITTLWYAQYCLDNDDIETAEKVLDWVHSHAYESGVLSEQIRPDNELSTSVAPLTWSHAEYATTILDMLNESSSS